MFWKTPSGILISEETKEKPYCQYYHSMIVLFLCPLVEVNHCVSKSLHCYSQEILGNKMMDINEFVERNQNEILDIFEKISFEEASTKFSEKIQDVLENTFGYTNFRGNQREAILSILSLHDSFVLMPTGGGKSLCFQIPALLFPGVTLVISPLIALMEDQVSALKKLNVPAEVLSSSSVSNEIEGILRDIQSNRPSIKLLYVTPERIATPRFSKIINSMKQKNTISFVAIDEAHCISSWGVGFRPTYRKLDVFKRIFEIPVMALTATATHKVRNDIVTSLRMEEPNTYATSFDRPNISYFVKYKDEFHDRDEVIDDIEKFVLNKIGECGIIYCHKREDCDYVSYTLRSKGVNIDSFHGSVSAQKKKRLLESWTDGKVHIIASTIAFGMGIDKSNVRFVIHYTIPKSFEGFYQQSGRAGRDGEPSVSIVYYSIEDESNLEYLVSIPDKSKNNAANEKRKEIKLSALREVVRYCTSKGCKRKRLLSYFGESQVECNNGCDWCINKRDVEERLLRLGGEEVLPEITPPINSEKSSSELSRYSKREISSTISKVGIKRGTRRGMKRKKTDTTENEPRVSRGGSKRKKKKFIPPKRIDGGIPKKRKL
eukprot:TRINITY_DN2773_c1_g1_i1.p1 TRINITY_DN2773_c1_g1~~TRINITY_DN2773_c1_g1_i1.p1  ORF type:complete len:603 (+),score=133.89 TRINITY_DN2773_c1_g1_i1:357-2165(+)